MSDLKYGKIRMNDAAGKGTIHRPTDYDSYDANYEKIFGDRRQSKKSKINIVEDIVDNSGEAFGNKNFDDLA